MLLQTMSVNNVQIGQYPLNFVVEDRPEYTGLMLTTAPTNADENVIWQIRQLDNGVLGIFVFPKSQAEIFEQVIPPNWQESPVVFDSRRV